MPLVPLRPTIREKLRGGSIDIRWQTSHADVTGDATHPSGGPVLYIIEARHNVGRSFAQELMTGWQQIAQVCP